MSSFRPPGECPVCGAELPSTAKACPDCGACDKTGWNEDAEYSHLNLPSSEYDDSLPPEDQKPARPAFLPTVLLVVLALILSGAWFLFQRH